MKYDDASWHYEGEFPSTSPAEYGAVHIGVFVRLMFENGMAGALHTENWPADVEKLTSGEWSGTKFVMDVMDGVMTDEDFNETGNKFARAYYADHYIGDFLDHSEIDLYEDPEEKVNMEAIEDMFEIRLEAFERSGDPMKEIN